MPHPVWFVLGAIGGWYLHKYMSSDPDRIAGALQRETSHILDGITRMAQGGALHQVGNMNLSHGNKGSKVELQLTTKRPDDFFSIR